MTSFVVTDGPQFVRREPIESLDDLGMPQVSEGRVWPVATTVGSGVESASGRRWPDWPIARVEAGPNDRRPGRAATDGALTGSAVTVSNGSVCGSFAAPLLGFVQLAASGGDGQRNRGPGRGDLSGDALPVQLDQPGEFPRWLSP